jgi:hypothetical protein
MLKSENPYSCDYDFVQQGGAMNELTVTITLAEYRDLIEDVTRLNIELDQLKAEKKELEDKAKSLSEALAACELPRWIKAFANSLAHWGEDQDDDSDDEAEESEDQEDTD